MKKKRMMMVVALAMMIVVLAAGTAQAGTRAPSLTLTNKTGNHLAPLNGWQAAAFTITETNNEPFAVDHVQVLDNLPVGVQFEKVTLNVWDQNGAPLEHSQEQCSFVPGGPNDSGSVICNLGTLPPGATAVIDVVVTPLQPGIIINNAYDSVGNSASESILVYPA
jgi:uncharacterized repeat protein (TIGR01451 family)